MKPIGHLDCMGGTLFGGLGISAATIPGNHFYIRVLFQPGLQALDGTVGKQVNDLMLVQIDKNRSVALAFAPGPVVYSQMSDWIAGRDVASTSGIGSAKILRPQAWLRHRRRRAFKRSSTAHPCQGRSFSRRRYVL
jgi:hypothetical protein